MARYIHDFRDISADPRPSGGLDPNYRNGYRGMRQGADPGQGAYGRYRWEHRGDLEGSGGYAGRSMLPAHEAYDRNYARGRFYDWETRSDGGLRNPRYDREFIRGFNANSQNFRREGRWQRHYGADYRERGDHPMQGDSRYRFGYGNAGLTDSGFSEAWQHRPGPGSR